jgi:hypothetical protein
MPKQTEFDLQACEDLLSDWASEWAASSWERIPARRPAAPVLNWDRRAAIGRQRQAAIRKARDLTESRESARARSFDVVAAMAIATRPMTGADVDAPDTLPRGRDLQESEGAPSPLPVRVRTVEFFTM